MLKAGGAHLLECFLVTARKRSLGQGNAFTGVCLSTGVWASAYKASGVCLWGGEWGGRYASYWNAFLYLPNAQRHDACYTPALGG